MLKIATPGKLLYLYAIKCIMDNTVLFSKLSSLPEEMKSEVIDFIDFLLTKVKKEKPVTESNKEKPTPKFGSGKGFFILKDGWDDPLDEEFKEYM